MSSSAATALYGPSIEVVARTRLVSERTMPVAEPLRRLLPRGLVRGQSLTCSGPAGVTLAFSLVAEAAQAGSWVAALDLADLAAEAVAEVGVPLERLVRVCSDGGPQSWGEAVAAAVDGFELVVSRPPPGVRPGLLRRLQARLATHGGVLVLVGPETGGDVHLRTQAPTWHHAAGDAGHLIGRTAAVVTAGRRVHASHSVELWLPGPEGITTATRPRLGIVS